MECHRLLEQILVVQEKIQRRRIEGICLLRKSGKTPEEKGCEESREYGHPQGS
jgi:hypothetical protein